MITVITPTGDRPTTFKLLLYYMERQTVKPDLWVVIDDGVTDSTQQLLRGCKVTVLYKRLPPYYTHSLSRNIREALPHVSGKVLIMEDDDYYSPEHIEHIVKLLDVSDLVGRKSRYYVHVPSNKYKHMNGRFAVLHSVGLKGHAVNVLCGVVQDDHHDVDARLYREFTGRALFYTENTVIHVTGHIPAKERGGTTPTHRTPSNLDSRWLPNASSYFNTIMGDDVYLYFPRKGEGLSTNEAEVGDTHSPCN